MRNHNDGMGKNSLRQSAVGVSGMVFATLLALTVSVPAHAVNPDTVGALPQSGSGSAPAQSISVNAAGTPDIARDGYTVDVQAPPAPAAPAAPGLPAEQPAGVAIPSAAFDSAVQWPFRGGAPLSGDYGPRAAPCAGCSTFHDGLDMIPGAGTPIGSVAAGVVREATAYDNGGLGVHAIIDHIVDGQNVTTVYGHMQAGSLTVSAGQSVAVGQILGNVGNTGQSTGAHLHLELLVNGASTDPFPWLTARAGAV